MLSSARLHAYAHAVQSQPRSLVLLPQGVFTGGLMILSPAMFARMGWKEVAAATPQVLLVGGAAFFAACIAYKSWVAGAHAALAAGTSTSELRWAQRALLCILTCCLHQSLLLVYWLLAEARC